MVTRFGFSDALGPMDLYSEYERLSSEAKQKIEDEVRRILTEGRERATKILTERRKELDLLAKALVEYEVLNRDEVQRVLKGEKLQKLTANPDRPIKLPDLILTPGLGGGTSGLGEKVPGLSGGSPSPESPGIGAEGASRP